MKHLVLIRHAKSTPYGYEDDFNRDLSERGNKDAKLISTELNTKGILPDIMISSPAKRAIKTAGIFAENLGLNKKTIKKVQEIYTGMTTSEFLGLINDLPDNAGTVFIFGHNPGFYYCTSNLLQKFKDDMPTCSTVGIDFDVDSWKNVTARSGLKAFQLIPRMFK